MEVCVLPLHSTRALVASPTIQPHSQRAELARAFDAAEPTVDRKQTILVVEDEESVRRLFMKSLSASSYRVQCAACASAALAIALTSPPDLILLDLKLPDLHGLGLLRLLQLRGVSSHVLVVSGVLTGDVTEDLLNLGVVRTIPKPFRMTEVLRVMTEALRSPRILASIKTTADVAHRWAVLVLRGCDGDTDIRTIPDWAEKACTSPATLREICRLVCVQPHDAHDLARLLNALLRAHRHGARIESMLDVGDHRTLDRLLDSAAVRGIRTLPTVQAFLQGQRFVAHDNDGMRTLSALIGESPDAA